MFTGIVEAVGRVLARDGLTVRIGCGFDGLAIGDSVAVSGTCLTVTAFGDGWFAAGLSEETLARTSLGDLAVGSPVNLERPLTAGGRLGGHVVQGHVDGTAVVTAVDVKDGSTEVWFRPAPALSRYLVEKGSVALDGISLTVARLRPGEFSVAVIPHTLNATNLGARSPGDRVNVEVDILAKYVESLLRPEQVAGGPVSRGRSVSKEEL
ncbi:MAG TPA: riboflavin synthase [Actinomycetota bacterium]|nr:riboflavin synthase [Actinomycetota bacterium]